jgi:hypothetical protein
MNDATLIRNVAKTKSEMQNCYQDLKDRAGEVQFTTCFIAEFDSHGNRDVFHLSSKSIGSDEEFISCAKKILEDFSSPGLSRNAFLVHAYHFYLSSE